MRTPAAAAAFLCLSLFSCPGLGAEAERTPLIDAPRELVGTTVAEWVRFFGPDYQIVEPETSRSPHDDSPIVLLRITDGRGTTALFGVNLVSNRHMLYEVESVSEDFLTYVGADELVSDECRHAGASFCWDDGCDLVNVHFSSDGDYNAVWRFSWD